MSPEPGQEGVLLFGPGLTDVCLHADDTWVVLFSRAVIVARGRDLEAHELTMTARFVPEPGSGGDQLVVLDGGPAGFSPQGSSVAAEATYRYLFGADEGMAVHITDGHWFGTVPGADQVGTFEVCFEAPDFRPARFAVHVPTAHRLVFDPGTSYARPVPDPDRGSVDVWALHLEDASVTVTGGVISEPLHLQLTVRFVPDVETDISTVFANGLAPEGWRPPHGLNPHTEAIFCYDGTVDASEEDVVLGLSDGVYVTTASATVPWEGHFELRFSELGFPSTTHLVRAGHHPLR